MDGGDDGGDDDEVDVVEVRFLHGFTYKNDE